MKKSNRAFLLGVLGLLQACFSSNLLEAQTFTTLHVFNASDGQKPAAGLLLSGNILYGTTEYGGPAGEGTVFAINTDGSGFTNLHSFTAPSHGVNNDGGIPLAALILSGSALFGTADYGGSAANGTVFSVNAQNGAFALVHNFGGDQLGQNPVAAVVASGNTLYGTTYYGGKAVGGIFAVNTDSTGFTNLYNFTVPVGVPGTNSDAAYPAAALILSSNNLYGTTPNGGAFAGGTVFRFNVAGGGFTTLHNFTTGVDGATPMSSLLLSGNTLYGTTVAGGSANYGTVFAISLDGSSFSTLYSFTNGADGSHPYAGLVLSGNALYGTQIGTGYGSIFKVNTDATGFAPLYYFTNGTDGAFPAAPLVLSGNTLYGTAESGGSASGDGTVFSLSLAVAKAPQLSIVRSGANVILTWPTNATGFSLQSTANLPPRTLWNAVSPGASIVNGLNTVTNAIAGSRMFYRLSQ